MLRHAAPTTSAVDDRSGKRNRFFLKKQMRAEDFDLEQRYFIERRRLVNRAVLGWGVVYGLGVDVSSDATPVVHVGRGLALDRHGREIALGAPVAVGRDNTFVQGHGPDGCPPISIDRIEAGRYVLAAHYAERPTGDANLAAGCGCAKPEKKYVCETVLFSLRKLCVPGCPCAETPCSRTCRCGSDTCCTAGRGPHACLCEWATHADVPDVGESLCEWQGYWLCPGDAVDLACVAVERTDDECNPFVIRTVEDACSPRRLVKTNDVLYDLIRGCDLTRIADISWSQWHRAAGSMPWDEFAAMFQVPHQPAGTTDFVIGFTGPVRADTIGVDTVVMRAVILEQATGWRVTRRVPLNRIDTAPRRAAPGTPPLPTGTTDQIRLHVNPRWIKDEIDPDDESWLSHREFWIEIEVRGDFILDCHGQALDADARGFQIESGNGAPGGTYLSTFRVQPKPAEGSDRVS